MYVDDFRMSGPKADLSTGCKSLEDSGLVLTNIEPVKRYMGCDHERVESTVAGRPVVGMAYDMRDFMTACVDNYLELFREPRTALHKVDTPSLPASGDTFPEAADFDSGESGILQEVGCVVLM